MASIVTLRPLGPSQVAPALALRERLHTQPAAAEVKAQVADDFDQALSAFRSSIEGREAGARDKLRRQARVTTPRIPTGTC